MFPGNARWHSQGLDHRWVFNAGDDFDRTTTFTAGFNVDVG